MSSSIFEVKESESDSEKVLEFGLDTCEENGIMSTQIDSELPKDHTYTKEPDVLQEDGMRDSDNSSNQVEEMGSVASSPMKSKSTRATKTATKGVGKGKPKKTVVAKKEPPKKGKTKKDDISEEVEAISESAGNGQIDPTVEAANANEEDSKPSKRGRKRKIEDKGNVEDEGTKDEEEDSTANENSEKNPKKRNASAAKTKKVIKGKGVDAEDTVIDHDNLPPGWVRKSVVRKSGKTAGQIDVYIYSPDGFKFRSKPDVASYLARTKSNLKLEYFDFGKKRATEKPSSPSTTKQAPQKKPVAEKPKTPVKKKSKPTSSKKSPTLLVKIMSAKPRKSRATKESPVKGKKSSAKGKVSKVNKKKTNA